MFFHNPVCKKRMLVFEWAAKLTMPLQTYREGVQNSVSA